MVYLIFTCIDGTIQFVYKNDMGNVFVKAVYHSISSYAELVLLSLVQANCIFVIPDRIPSVGRQWATYVIAVRKFCFKVLM